MYQEEIPGYMAGYAAVKLGYRKLGFLGGQAPYGASNLHNPQFDFDDRVLSTGAALWVTIARRRLAES